MHAFAAWGGGEAAVRDLADQDVGPVEGPGRVVLRDAQEGLVLRGRERDRTARDQDPDVADAPAVELAGLSDLDDAEVPETHAVEGGRRAQEPPLDPVEPVDGGTTQERGERHGNNVRDSGEVYPTGTC